jgi:hypothetical protein
MVEQDCKALATDGLLGGVARMRWVEQSDWVVADPRPKRWPFTTAHSQRPHASFVRRPAGTSFAALCESPLWSRPRCR